MKHCRNHFVVYIPEDICSLSWSGESDLSNPSCIHRLVVLLNSFRLTISAQTEITKKKTKEDLTKCFFSFGSSLENIWS